MVKRLPVNFTTFPILYNHTTLKQNQESNIDTLLLANLYVKFYSEFASCSTIVLFLVQDPIQDQCLTVILWTVSQFVLSSVSS